MSLRISSASLAVLRNSLVGSMPGELRSAIQEVLSATQRSELEHRLRLKHAFLGAIENSDSDTLVKVVTNLVDLIPEEQKWQAVSANLATLAAAESNTVESLLDDVDLDEDELASLQSQTQPTAFGNGGAAQQAVRQPVTSPPGEPVRPAEDVPHGDFALLDEESGIYQRTR